MDNMDKNAEFSMRKRIEKTAKNLKENNMEVYIAENFADAVATVKKLIKPGDTISSGGSMSLIESGVMELLQSGDYNYLDRANTDDVEKLYRDTFSADAYLCSCNAVTENGELYNVDGNSNRVAAIAYGPKSVIMVVGINKLVPDLESAAKRVKTFAAPPNCVRLSCNTFCSKTGECSGLSDNMTDGCANNARICCNYLISARQRQIGRIKIIFVMKNLGY